jgi:hypothetical protein
MHFRIYFITDCDAHDIGLDAMPSQTKIAGPRPLRYDIISGLRRTATNFSFDWVSTIFAESPHAQLSAPPLRRITTPRPGRYFEGSLSFLS